MEIVSPELELPCETEIEFVDNPKEKSGIGGGGWMEEDPPPHPAHIEASRMKSRMGTR